MIEFFVKGGPVMYPLLACSIIALTVVIERILFWIREDMRRNQPLVDDVLELCQKGDWDSVREKVKGSKDYVHSHSRQRHSSPGVFHDQGHGDRRC